MQGASTCGGLAQAPVTVNTNQLAAQQRTHRREDGGLIHIPPAKDLNQIRHANTSFAVAIIIHTAQNVSLDRINLMFNLQRLPQ